MEQAFWDNRYAAGLVYGEAANEFLVSMVSGRAARGATALDIGAGEGRNALYLASLGYRTLAMDQSVVGMDKALKRARDRGLPDGSLRAVAADLRDFQADPESFDLISSIFVHLPQGLRANVHANVARWLKPGGRFILEAYAPEQLARNTGGPKDLALLAPLDVMLSELNGLTIEHAARAVRVVVEGSYHTGEADVVQVVARK